MLRRFAPQTLATPRALQPRLLATAAAASKKKDSQQVHDARLFL